jgi:hypothetical protein
VLGGVLLRPAALTTDLGDAPSHVVDHPLRRLAFHGLERRPR